MAKNIFYKNYGFWHELLESFTIAMSVSIIVYYIFLMPNRVDGKSMEPTFHDSELLFTNRIVQWLGGMDIAKGLNINYQRGDIVIFTHSDIDLIKRVIALPGDKLLFKNGDVFLNGTKLNEGYLVADVKTFLPYQSYRYSPITAEGEELQIPANYYFVMGDNRSQSHDSRFADIGLVHRDLLKGKVILRYWPFSGFKFF